MALSSIFRFVIRRLHEKQPFPTGGRLLEIGEGNWYGNVQEAELLQDIDRFVDDQARRDELKQRVAEVFDDQGPEATFAIVKVFYDIFFSPTETIAIDFGGTISALRLDLNQPVELPHRYNVVINHGTAEHIFRIAQVFRTMHHYTAPGGVMIHESPFVGWIDHGFYNPTPTLFLELAQCNQYDLMGMFLLDLTNQLAIQIDRHEKVALLAQEGRLPKNANLVLVMRKGPLETPFRFPTKATRSAASGGSQALLQPGQY
jgi:hypothetical protein